MNGEMKENLKYSLSTFNMFLDAYFTYLLVSWETVHQDTIKWEQNLLYMLVPMQSILMGEVTLPPLCLAAYVSF